MSRFSWRGHSCERQLAYAGLTRRQRPKAPTRMSALQATGLRHKGSRHNIAATRISEERLKSFSSTARNHGDEIRSSETREAVNQLEAIAPVEGVDGIFIGPSDLAADLGHLADTRHPEVQATIADACVRIRAAGKPAGMLSGDPEEATRYFDNGFTFVAVGSDIGLLANGAAKRAADFHRHLADRLTDRKS